jgi:hypothetical protein
MTREIKTKKDEPRENTANLFHGGVSKDHF